MKRVVDFKAEAREALAGKWPAAVLTGFLAGLIGTADMSDVFTTSISREDLEITKAANPQKHTW